MEEKKNHEPEDTEEEVEAYGRPQRKSAFTEDFTGASSAREVIRHGSTSVMQFFERRSFDEESLSNEHKTILRIFKAVQVHPDTYGTISREELFKAMEHLNISRFDEPKWDEKNRIGFKEFCAFVEDQQNRMKELELIFNIYDTGGNTSTIYDSNLSTVIRGLGYILYEEDLDAARKNILDGASLTGRITLDEVISCVQYVTFKNNEREVTRPTHEDLLKALADLDVKGKNSVTPQEMKKIMESVLAHDMVSGQEIDDLIRSFDDDDSGELSYEELASGLLGDWPPPLPGNA